MKHKKTTLGTTILFLIGIIFLVGCTTTQQTQEANTNEKIKIVSTIGMIHDVAKNIGKEHIDAIALMGPGVDPHLYKASESDVRKLSNADIIFYNGLHLESQMGEVFDAMSEKVTVAVADSIDTSLLLSDPEYEGQHDPHVWFDVELWIQAANEIKNTLVEFDPENAAEYEANAQAYVNQMQALHEYVKTESERIPEEARVLVTAHDAFSYFGEAYGFEVVGLQGLSTEAKAGTKDVQDLADFVTDRKIKAMFVETSISERNIEAVQEAVKDRGWDVTIGGSLFSDAMGDEGTTEGTYLGMVRHNIDTIVTALS